MKLILLPGMDGAGRLFAPLCERVGRTWDIQVISYPAGGAQDYEYLARYVRDQLPHDDDFIVLAESFSGPVAYLLGVAPPPGLKAIVFVATFLESPRPVLLWIFKNIFRVVGRIRPPRFIVRKYLLGSAEQTLYELFWEAVTANPIATMMARMNSILVLPVAERQVRVPCAYIRPQDDKLVPKRCMERFKKVAPHLRLYEVAGPHFVLQANAEECVAVIERERLLLSRHV